MSEPGGGTSGWLEVLRHGWRRGRDHLGALDFAFAAGGWESRIPILAIDIQDDAAVLRRLADGTSTELARLPREDFTPAGLRKALAAHLRRSALLREPFVLRLPDAAALKRNLTLPLAARRGIGSLLEIELDRQSPVDRDEVYHDYRIVGVDRRAGTIDVAWNIVRRKNVDPAIETCREAGIGLAFVAFAGDDTPPTGGNFPVEPRAALLLRARQWTVRGLALLVVALLIAVLAGAYMRNQQAYEALVAKVDGARSAARGSLQLEDRIVAAHARAGRLLAEKRRPAVVRLLAETTRLLPDGTWLTGFSYRDGDVRLQGYSNASSSLIAIFDASPLFADAEFGAPLVQAQDKNYEQFDLSLKVRKDAK